MHFGGRLVGVVVMNVSVQVRSVVWVGGMQFGGRRSGVKGMSATSWVRSAVWAEQMQFGERMVVMKAAVRVKSTIWVGGSETG